MKFEIKSWINGGVLFSFETDSLRLAVEAAVRSGADLSGTNLRGADLRGANLRGADLRGADLRCADLYGADLRGADLHGSDLRCADLYGSDLSGTNLRGSDLRCADLYGSNLSGSDLYGTNLRGADLRCADLRGANNIPALQLAQTRILPEGDLIGWKKSGDGKIVKLRVPGDAKRSHAFGRKCRCEFADVLEVVGGGMAITNTHGPETIYEAGKRVTADKWDEDFMNECSHGIHFFITREEAEGWDS